MARVLEFNIIKSIIDLLEDEQFVMVLDDMLAMFILQITKKDNGLVATLALGSRPRQKGLQGCGPRGNPGVTSEIPGNVGECEGVSHHTPKATPTLGEGV